MNFTVEEFIERELEKPDVGDFTLSEYNEKGSGDELNIWYIMKRKTFFLLISVVMIHI